MRKVTLAAIAVLCLIAGYGFAQTQKQEPPRQLEIEMPKPIDLNDNLAFRVEGMHDGRVVGTLLVKVDGRWVEASLASKNVRAGQH